MPNSVEKTMIILRAISDGKGAPVSLERISSDTGINKSTLSHIVSILTKSGYLQRISHNEGYIIGPELHFLTRYGRYGEDIISVSHPILEYLNKRTDALAVFAVLGNEKKYIIDRVSSQNIYRDGDAAILNDDIYRTVTGRVLLANAAPDRALEIYKKLGAPDTSTWQKAVTTEGFLSQLCIIRDTPCYYIKSSSGSFVWHSFAVPIFDRKKCEGALGLAIRNDNTSDNTVEIEGYTALMLKCKRETERRLKFM